jgi:hypothetical protein
MGGFRLLPQSIKDEQVRFLVRELVAPGTRSCPAIRVHRGLRAEIYRAAGELRSRFRSASPIIERKCYVLAPHAGLNMEGHNSLWIERLARHNVFEGYGRHSPFSRIFRHTYRPVGENIGRNRCSVLLGLKTWIG